MNTQATRTPGRLKQGATVGTVVIAATAAALLGAGGGVAITALHDAPSGPQGEPGVQGPSGFDGMAQLVYGSDYLANGVDDLNCADIADVNFPTPPVDEDGLDGNGDGIACEV
jgi:hypothetical protein